MVVDVDNKLLDELIETVNQSNWFKIESCVKAPPGGTSWEQMQNLQFKYLFFWIILPKDKPISRLRKFIKNINDSFKGREGWVANLMFDCVEENSTRWYFDLHYNNDFRNQDIAIKLFLDKFTEMVNKGLK